MAEKEDARTRTLKQIISHNVTELLNRDFPNEKGQHGKFVKRHKETLKIHLSRIQEASTKGTVNLATLEKLAIAFKLKPYQLLINDLNVKEPQVAIPRRRFETLQKMAKEITDPETQS